MRVGRVTAATAVNHALALNARSNEYCRERFHLAIEFGVLFGLIPLLLVFRTVDVPFGLLLLSAFVTCLLLLWRDPTFDRSLLWNVEGAKRGLWGMLGLFVVGILVLGWFTKTMTPQLYLAWPRENPLAWAATMIGYPLLSVYPQNIVYRAFIFHRYRNLFTTERGMVLASASAFCWAHILFENSVAMVLTGLGGLIFAGTYARHRSTLLCSIEHALYGCLIFTLGLGWYVYQAAR
jgi:membrane protease YdiL (CAAX protease family)